MAKRTGGRESGRRRGFEALEGRQLLAAPVIEPIPAVDVPGAKTLFVPLRGSDADGDPISFAVSSDSAGVQAEVRSGRPFLRFSVEGFGDLEFQLFDDLAPETVRQITELVNDDFYDGLTFHRVIPGFVIQGGDPEGDGSGGPGFRFEDEFAPSAIFRGSGQLAMANSGKDTNGSQFFVTLGPQRPLDFNHTIFGQLVRGADVAEAIADVQAGAGGRPTTPVVISDARIVTNTTDSVLLIRAEDGADSATITVTASDGTGGSDSETIAVDVVADSVDDPPILGPIGDQTAVAGFPRVFGLSSVDLEGDPVEYEATLLDNADRASVSVSGSQVTVTPQAGFTGELSLRVGVKQQGATHRGSTANPFDTEVITVSVRAPSISAEGVAVAGSSGEALGNVPVARFSGAAGTTTSGYSAAINWGDGTIAAGSVRERSGGGFEVVGSHTFGAGGSFPVNVVITGPDGETASASSTATISGAQAASIEVALGANAGTITLGGDVTYTILLSNTGTAPAQGVSVFQSLPAGATLVSSSIPPSSRSGDRITFDLGTLGVGETRTVTVVARPTAVGTVTSGVLVSGEGISVGSEVIETAVVASQAPAAPPRVVDLERSGTGLDPTRIVLSFDRPLDPATAEDPDSYRLVLPGGDHRMGTGDDLLVPIVRATYDDQARTVTLEPRHRLPYLAFARLEVRSGGDSGVFGGGGLALDGDGDGQAGGSFVARFGRGVYVDRAEVLRESAGADGPGPIRLVVRTGGHAYRAGEIAPLFARSEATDRFLIASGLSAISADGAGVGSAARVSGPGIPLGPLAAFRSTRPR